MWVPRNGTVFVKKEAAKTTTEGGIHLPTEQVELTQTGEITHVSNNTAYWVGAKVLFSKFAGSELKVDGQSLFIIQEDDILAFWHNGEENVLG